MQSVKVRRSGISADQAAEVLRFRLGGQYQVRADDSTQLRISKGPARAKVSLRAEPDGTVFEVSGEAGVSVMPLTSFITKMVNERGIAKRTATVIGQAEAFRGDG
jgi:type II secretory pathway component PulK